MTRVDRYELMERVVLAIGLVERSLCADAVDQVPERFAMLRGLDKWARATWDLFKDEPLRSELPVPAEFADDYDPLPPAVTS